MKRLDAKRFVALAAALLAPTIVECAGTAASTPVTLSPRSGP